MKAIFNRAPLVRNTRAPLGPGAVRPEGWLKDQTNRMKQLLEQLTGDPWTDASGKRVWDPAGPGAVYLENLVSLAWAVGDDALKARARDLAEWLIASQREDGWFGPDEESGYSPSVAVLRALRRYFLATGEKRVLVMMDRFFKYQYRTLAEKPLRGRDVALGGDNMELCLWLYDITEQKYLLELCRRLKDQTLDWTGYFHTFPTVLPMKKSLTEARLQEGIREEEADGDTLEGLKRPYFHVQRELTNGKALASGLKAPGIINLFKSGFKEQNGFRVGWEKLMKYHGTACGMYTCDGHLNGGNPGQGIDVRAAAELLRTLEALICLDNSGQDIAALLEKIACNVLPAAFDAESGKPACLQQVNQVAVTREKRRWYSAGDGATQFRMDEDLFYEIFGAWAQFAESLWYATDDDGLYAASYAPCTVRRNLGGTSVRLTVSGGYPFSDTVRIRIDARQSAEFPLYLRIPAWVRQPMIHLPDGSIMQIRPGETPCVRQVWNPGDELTLSLPTAPRLTRWYHQSGAIEVGPLVMVWQPEEERREEEDGAVSVRSNEAWNWALLRDEPMKLLYGDSEDAAFGGNEPGVLVYVRAVSIDWPMENGSTGSLPMAPEMKCAPQTLCLVPYGGTALRIAQFPIAIIPRSEREKEL